MNKLLLKRAEKRIYRIIKIYFVNSELIERKEKLFKIKMKEDIMDIVRELLE